MLKRDQEQSSRHSRLGLRSPLRNSPSSFTHSFESRGMPRSLDPAGHLSWASRMDEEESDCHHHNLEEEIEWMWGEPDVGEAQREGSIREDVQTPHQGRFMQRQQQGKAVMLKVMPSTKGSSHQIAQLRPLHEDRGLLKCEGRR